MPEDLPSEPRSQRRVKETAAFADLLKGYFLALRGMMRVWHALLLRDMIGRFGESRLGFLSFFIEPSIYVGLIITLRALVGGGVTPFGVDAPLFVITGIVPFFLFRNCLSKCSDAAGAAKAILFMPEVQLFDIYVPKIMLEVALALALFVCSLAVMAYFGHTSHIENLLGVLGGMGLAALAGGGMGLHAAVFFSIWPGFKPMLGMVLRVLMVTSGAIFPVTAVPDELRHYVTWNPMFHVLEYIRSAFFPVYESYISNGDDLSAVWLWIGISWVTGVPLVRRMRARIMQR